MTKTVHLRQTAIKRSFHRKCLFHVSAAMFNAKTGRQFPISPHFAAYAAPKGGQGAGQLFALHLSAAGSRETYVASVIRQGEMSPIPSIQLSRLSLHRMLASPPRLSPNSTMPTFPLRLRQVGDKPVTSPLALIPLRRLTRNFPRASA